MMDEGILVIDDDEDLNSAISDFLRDVGYTVYSITNPLKVMTAIKKNSYKIIFLDLKMPHISGVELITKIKNKNPEIKIFIMSGQPYIENFLNQHNLLTFVDGILNKPFGGEELLEKIKSLENEDPTDINS
jgi:DNA-binding NtrC family response regulator